MKQRNNSVFDFHLYVCIFYKIPTERNMNYKNEWAWGSGGVREMRGSEGDEGDKQKLLTPNSQCPI
jgi:hypothetical protein